MAKRADDVFEGEGTEQQRSSVDWTGFGDLWERQRDRVRNPGARGYTTGAVVAWALALFMVYLTWNGAAERSNVALQVPYLISGGFVIVLLTVVGAALFLVGAIRRLADDEEAEPAPEPPRSIGEPRR